MLDSPNEFDYNCQSLVESGPEKIHTLRLRSHNDRKTDDFRTLHDILPRGMKLSNNGRCMGWRPTAISSYRWFKYDEVIRKAENFGRGLRRLGLDEKALVGIHSANCLEWIICEQGLFNYSMVTVPLFDALGSEACRFIIEQCELDTVICEDDTKVNLLMDEDGSKCLKHLICIKEVRVETIARAAKLGLVVFGFDEIEKMGELQKYNLDYEKKIPSPDDICSINYTSGTTGRPKGAILTHGNMVASISNLMINQAKLKIDCRDTIISFLPLAHIYERVIEGYVYAVGGSVGFFRGDILKLVDDIQALQPTIMPCVPRLLNRIYDKVMNTAKGSIVKRSVLKMALKKKGEEVLQKNRIRTDSIWDFVVFRKIQNLFGGRLRAILSAAAPVNDQVLTFFRSALGCEVIECYGQTEASGPITCLIPGDYYPGHVGPPCPGVSVKLVDVPELQYYSKNGQGEIYIKGANVAKGYYKNPEETAAVFEDSGWFKTGDIGAWQSRGTLKIIDRKKNIFKLSQGEYIAPEKIEEIYLKSPFVAQVFVYGNSLKSCLIGIVVPDFEVLSSPSFLPPSLCQCNEIKSTILKDLIKQGKTHGLQSFEQVKDIYLHPDPFTTENGLLTPTMKTKRVEVQKYFKPQLDNMYLRFN